MPHKDSFIKLNKEFSKPMDSFNVGFVGSLGLIPDQVTGVAVTPDSTTELTVSWNAVTAHPAVSGYLVERSPNGTDSWTTVASSNSSTSFGDSGLSVYTVYYYRVSAINGIGTGLPSAVANNRTLGTAPGTPTGLSATANSTSQITISWNAVSATPAVTSYTLEWSANGSSGWTSIHSSTDTSKAHTGLSTYTLYYYRVKATNAVGSSSYSSNVSARTNGTTPTTPTLTLTDNDPDVGISWTTSTGNPSVTYTLEHSLSSTFASGVTTKTSGGTSTTYTDSNVTTDVVHYYRVKGVNAYTSGSYSSIQNIEISGSLSGYIGVFGGDSNVMDYVTIATTGNATDFGDLSVSKQLLAGCHSSTRGVFSGGLNTNAIDYITIVITGNATDFGDMTVKRWNLTGLNSTTRGCFAGGYENTRRDIIDYITIASTGNATDFGNLSAQKQQLAGCHSSTRGCFGGGYSGGNSNVIDYITISTTGNASDFGDLTSARRCRGGANSSTRGIFAGGNNTMDYITIASTGNATDFGDLNFSVSNVSGVHSDVRAVFASDFNGIDYVTIASTSNATDFGDLTANRNHGGVNN